MDDVRKFSVCTVLTLTTGHVLTASKGESDNGFGDLYDLMGHMLGESPSTSTLKVAADICKPHIFHWHPELNSLELWSELKKLLSLFKQDVDSYIQDAIITGWINSLVTRGICKREYDIGHIGANHANLKAT